MTGHLDFSQTRVAWSRESVTNLILLSAESPGLSLRTNSPIPLYLPEADDEDVASLQACETAERILREYSGIAENKNTFSVAPATLSQFEHQIMMGWERSRKTVIIICPEDGSAPRLYRELATEDGGSITNLQSNATTENLFDGIAWMLSGISEL